MIRRLRHFKGQTATEVMALLMFILIAMLVFQKYIARGIWGRWKSVGDTIGQSRIYDPNLTIECGYDRWENTGLWYNAVCFDSVCGIDDCVAATRTPAACTTCITTTCQSSYGGVDVCNQ